MTQNIASQCWRLSRLILKQNATGLIRDYRFFQQPPHRLRRPKPEDKRPLLVVFEKQDCDPCSRFHERVLGNNEVREFSEKLQSVQLDMQDNASKLITPDGRTVTPKQWSEELDLSYDMAIVFFDEKGSEVHRIDSECGKDRMTGSMQYVLEKAYECHEQFLRWRREQARSNTKG